MVENLLCKYRSICNGVVEGLDDFRPDAKPDDYIFQLLNKTAQYAKYAT